MARKKQYTRQITICLMPKKDDALNRIAKDTDIPKSRLVRQAIDIYLRQFPEYCED
jgi:predicted DNA-binding protein